MSTQTEIERKFLVNFPKSWSALSELFEDLVDIKRITQTYLRPKDDQEAPRVRKTIEGLVGDTQVVYDFNQKKPLEKAVFQEKEHEITKKQYEQYLQDPYPGKGTVEKIRFVFKYNDQIFELDVFKGPLKGLAILEIELDHKDDKIELPPFLEIIREVTGDKTFNNFELANRTHKT